jgi:transposase
MSMYILSEQQWLLLAPLLPKQRFKKGGRPRADDRKTLEGILWILKTGSQWGQLPQDYGSPMTCWRRLQRWQDDGVWDRMWRKLLKSLDQEEKLDWAMAFLDGSFAPAKKGGLVLAKPKKARAQSG